MKKNLSLEQELAETLRAVYALPARRVDDLEDYFHNAIVKVLDRGLDLQTWLPYVYRTVAKRVFCGQEGREFSPLDECTIPDRRVRNDDLIMDMEKALKVVSPQAERYIHDYFYEGMTLKEMSIKYNTTEQSISRCIHRGLNRMRKALSSGGEKV